MIALYITLALCALFFYCVWKAARTISVAETIEVLKDAKQVENDMASISPTELEQLRTKWTRK